MDTPQYCIVEELGHGGIGKVYGPYDRQELARSHAWAAAKANAIDSHRLYAEIDEDTIQVGRGPDDDNSDWYHVLPMQAVI